MTRYTFDLNLGTEARARSLKDSFARATSAFDIRVDAREPHLAFVDAQASTSAEALRTLREALLAAAGLNEDLIGASDSVQGWSYARPFNSETFVGLSADAVSGAHRGRADVVRWAIDVLRQRLGDAAAAELITDDRLHLAGVHRDAFAQLLDWGLWLETTAALDGAAKVRRDLKRNVQRSRRLHTATQLQLAASAVRLGWDVELEPITHPGSPPADVLLRAPLLSLEIKVRQASDAAKAAITASDRLNDWFGDLEWEHDAWIEGHCHRLLTESERASLSAFVGRWATGPRQRSTWTEGDLELDLLDRTAPWRGRRGPPIGLGGWERLVPSLLGKRDQMQMSGAGWLILEAHTGLWAFSKWAQLPVTDKLHRIREAVDNTLIDARPRGVVIMSPTRPSQGAVEPIHVATPDGVLLRQAIAPGRAREAIVLSYSGDEDVPRLIAWLEAATGWLDWALDELGLPSLDTML